MSHTSAIRRKTTKDIMKAKGHHKLVCLTAYTAPIAQMLDEHCDLLLVGDSVGMVLHGLPDTTAVTLDMMIMHGKAVMRGSQNALVVVDMPFGSFEESPQAAYRNALRVMQETGCQAVKLEYNSAAPETIRFLVDRGIPVVAHIGLRPQYLHVEGGYKVAGKNEESRQEQLECARQVAESGAFCVVVEGTKDEVAREISDSVPIPTIGIGASVDCDGQILVTDDMLGMFDKTPKFVRKYAELKSQIELGVKAFANDVRREQFPAADETY
ncbi:3-methyl-2-oxobutanoate hydroxymethyltransferase [Pseudovibrio sp. JE062]|uniref:3-methyl-2-oxobutanoate hydroxymethyltransferase n=1 Tax=Pseudovibrio sp. JE062 TaxID=439495 RepID=UPI0002DF76CA|nr:3-methyl-2-oxobutanoate hydroxymethyltransferase [Pseudovibrio sp. JE062]